MPCRRRRRFSPGRAAFTSISSRYTVTTLTGTLWAGGRDKQGMSRCELWGDALRLPPSASERRHCRRQTAEARVAVVNPAGTQLRLLTCWA